MEQKQIVKVHRVGTVTFGCLLILFGILFLVRLFVPALDYEVIFHMWPLIFIFLGIEVLAANHRVAGLIRQEAETVSFVYDKAAILLTICLSFFAMFMAAVDNAMRYREFYIY